MKVRLQKIIADSGHCSRRKAEALISEGRVTVNGRVAGLGDSADPVNDSVELDDIPLKRVEKVYFVLNKPPGYECTLRSTSGKPLAVNLVKTTHRIFPVGRLDADSRGLLLLTNDGEFANLIIHPRGSVSKEYWVKVRGIVSEADMVKLRAGVMIDGKVTRECQVDMLQFDRGASVLRITLHEGRKRQIRRMLDSVGYDVLDLLRTRVGCMTLDGLAEGAFRNLKAKEIEHMLELARGSKP
jgi:pseudouridine synthase